MARKRKTTEAAADEQRPPKDQASPAGAGDAKDPDLDLLNAELRRLQPQGGRTETRKERREFLTFWIAAEEYALPLTRAREITRCQSITRVPTTPVWIRGVTSVRGAVVPVVDLAPRIGWPATILGARTAVVLVDVAWAGEPMEMGLLVEGVGRVLAVGPDEIRPAPSFGTRVRREVLAGLLPAGEGFVTVLDPDRLMAAEELLAEDGPQDSGDLPPETSPPA